MNNDEYKYKYNEFSHILSGCRTIIDSYYFAELYIKKNPEMKNLIYSMINGKRYDNILDSVSMINLLEAINNCKYKEDANELMKTCNSDDNVQKKTLLRLIKNKPLKPIDVMLKEESIVPIPENIETKSAKCPHCKHVCVTDIGTKYIICGYVDKKTGYDWKGCGKDWCFECGKMLCKSWDGDQLFLEMNRHHDDQCCKLHAEEHHRDYLDYCHCTNTNVVRESQC